MNTEGRNNNCAKAISLNAIKIRVATLLGAAAIVLPTGLAHAAETGCQPCVLCSPGLAVPVVPLTEAWLDSLARHHASSNARQLERIDSLLQAGAFGPADEENAIKTAHLLARLATVNAYRDLVMLACDSTRVYEADEATLRRLYARYSDVNLFIDVRLVCVRIGMGRVCMRYNLDEKTEGVADHGGKQLRWRVKDAKIQGCKRRVLDLIFPSGADGEVEILLSSHHTFAVQYRQFEDGPAPGEWFVVRDIEGAWLRKWGTHRPTAYMFWVTAPRPAAPVMGVTASIPGTAALNALQPALELPSNPRVGLSIYIPGLKLKLPLLPDINVDDLRSLELPMPILENEYLRQHRYPSWLETNSHLGFNDWAPYGTLPAEIRREFPDR